MNSDGLRDASFVRLLVARCADNDPGTQQPFTAADAAVDVPRACDLRNVSLQRRGKWILKASAAIAVLKSLVNYASAHDDSLTPLLILCQHCQSRFNNADSVTSFFESIFGHQTDDDAARRKATVVVGLFHLLATLPPGVPTEAIACVMNEDALSAFALQHCAVEDEAPCGVTGHHRFKALVGWLATRTTPAVAIDFLLEHYTGVIVDRVIHEKSLQHIVKARSNPTASLFQLRRGDYPCLQRALSRRLPCSLAQTPLSSIEKSICAINAAVAALRDSGRPPVSLEDAAPAADGPSSNDIMSATIRNWDIRGRLMFDDQGGCLQLSYPLRAAQPSSAQTIPPERLWAFAEDVRVWRKLAVAKKDISIIVSHPFIACVGESQLAEAVDRLRAILLATYSDQKVTRMHVQHTGFVPLRSDVVGGRWETHPFKTGWYWAFRCEATPQPSSETSDTMQYAPPQVVGSAPLGAFDLDLYIPIADAALVTPCVVEDALLHDGRLEAVKDLVVAGHVGVAPTTVGVGLAALATAPARHQVLECVGDALWDFVHSEEIVKNFTVLDGDPDDARRIGAAVTARGSNAAFAAMPFATNVLAPLLPPAAGTDKRLADTIEAILGAVAMDRLLDPTSTTAVILDAVQSVASRIAAYPQPGHTDS